MILDPGGGRIDPVLRCGADNYRDFEGGLQTTRADVAAVGNPALI